MPLGLLFMSDLTTEKRNGFSMAITTKPCWMKAYSYLTCSAYVLYTSTTIVQ
ncbi:MAG: hypothetical protein F6K40_03090 [Okeania sp. SIO3I5]|uniref:hypothetical protein n=1 Tax=Okeania sp. SIO3I5 TaxID=2607805 RepID=UPI0013BDFA84|nr:hypothetical protein [Okeania sp. SIO3I5]NEQ35347.1 hypothetical protein [Okeania sp. SIO3I5]